MTTVATPFGSGRALRFIRQSKADLLEDDVADLLGEVAEARAFEVRHDDDGEALVGLHVEEGADALLPAGVADGALARGALRDAPAEAVGSLLAVLRPLRRVHQLQRLAL